MCTAATLIHNDITFPQVWTTDAHSFVVRSTLGAQPCYVLTVDATAAGLIGAALASCGKSESTFNRKTDKGSADLYFHYYGMLQHQQNMLQDYVRTGTYYAAILDNRIDFEGQAVCDVGAGSGILSMFAAQAGARVVYAVEASGMAHYASQLAAANAGAPHCQHATMLQRLRAQTWQTWCAWCEARWRR